ncbi:CPBP family intramembrane glutamic endopeptidase [Microbacteriaceae bacterium 4G12]
MENPATNEKTIESIEQFGWKNLIFSILVYLLMSVGIGVLLGGALGIYDALFNRHLVEKLFSGYPLLFIDALAFFLAFFAYRPVRMFLRGIWDFSVLKQGKTYMYLGIALIVNAAVQYIMLSVLGVESATQQRATLGVASLEHTALEYALYIIAVACVTPIKEELIFRGIVYRFLEQKYNFWIGIVVSSLFFGILHAGFPITAFIMGAIFAYLYKKTNSIVTPICLHIIWNLLGSVMQIMGS